MGDIFDNLGGDIFDDIHPQSVAEKAKANLARMNAAPSLDTSLGSEMAQTPLGGLAVGAAQGVGNTVYNLGKLAHNIPGMDTIAPDTAGAFSGPNEITQALEPQNGWQKAGQTAEQIGEFFVPGAAQAGKLSGIASLAQKGGIFGRIATEMLSAGGVAAAQGDNPLSAAAVAGAVPVIGKAAEKVAPKMMNTFLGVKPSNFEYGANPGLSVLKEKVSGVTESKFLANIKEKQGLVMGRINAALQRVPQNVAVDAGSAVAKPLDDAIALAQNFPEQHAILTGLRTQLMDDAAKMSSAGSVTSMAPAELNQFRKHVWDLADAAKGDAAVPEAVSKALDTVRRNLNDELAKSVPAARLLNHTYGNLREAEKAYRKKINSDQGQFWRMVAMMPAIRHIVTGNVVGAAKDVAGGLLVHGAMQSPAIVPPLARGLAAANNGTVQAIAPKLGGALAD